MELEESQECTICKGGMSGKPFDKSCEEGVFADCFRLPCKHAFHTVCLVQSLRTSGTNCPVCRHNGEGPQEAVAETLIFQADDEEENESEEAFQERLIHSLQSSNPRVIAAKRTLMQNVKSYNLLRDRLRHERRRSVASAMHDFRRRHFREFLIMKQRVKDSLEYFNGRLRDELHVTEGDMQFATVDEVLRQTPTLLSSVRRQDPLRTSFWH